MSHFLLVSDDLDRALPLQQLLAQRGYDSELATDTEATVQQLTRHTPRLLIYDSIAQPLGEYRFVEAVRNRSYLATFPIIVLSFSDRVSDRIRCLRSGADAYLVKPFEPEELFAFIEALLEQARRLRERPRFAFASSAFRSNQGIGGHALTLGGMPIQLTPKEQQVLECVARGQSNKEIAEKLTLSRRTVESYVSNLLSKMGASNRTQLTRWALERLH